MNDFMRHSTNLKKRSEHYQIKFQGIKMILTFVSGHEALNVLGNVLVEMQLSYVERFDDCAVVQHQ